MAAELVHIGFGNVLAMNRVVAIVVPDSAPSKRLIQGGKSRDLCIDMTNGRKTKAVIVTDSGHIILAPITPEAIAGRLKVARESQATKSKSREGSDEDGS
ncbi:MAG: DUF370 domain-containing protein [Chloroflexi bacterium]|nr:DUF370 domain-containing protein [Chloroflexota bacterium]